MALNTGLYGFTEFCSFVSGVDSYSGEIKYQLIPGGVTFKTRSTPFSDRMNLVSDYQLLSGSVSFRPSIQGGPFYLRSS
jgi:hypothetical protein